MIVFLFVLSIDRRIVSAKQTYIKWPELYDRIMFVTETTICCLYICNEMHHSYLYVFSSDKNNIDNDYLIPTGREREKTREF
jgi:hypothetical protein